MTEYSRLVEAPARRRPRQLFDVVRVRVSRKRWALYRVRLRSGVSRVLAMLLLAIGLPALAAPVGGRVVGGEAQITYGQTTTVKQTTPRTAINWQGFGIAPNEAVRFIQPSSSSVALNRVLGGNPTQILGTLTANGQVFIVNAQGVYFGRGAQVDTGGLVASTLSLSDADFNAGLYRFSGTSTASVKNDGRIAVTPGGYAVLAGAHVANEGTIVADNGSVALAGGSRVSLDLQGDRLVNYSVDASALRATVENAGLIQANGGSVSMLANVAGGALSTAVNQSGVIRANSVAEHDGIVSLRAIGGDTVVTGSIDVSGRGTGQTGGRVEVLGDRVGLFQDTSIDASGHSGGGTVLVGGDLHGEGGVPTSGRTVVDPGAHITADATVRGDGGKVVVWSDGNTSFNGHISARGGATGGNGGYVETSGRQILSVLEGGVDAAAPHGRSGTWLLDPNNLTIKDNGRENEHMEGWDTNDDNAVLDVNLLGEALTNGTSVVVRTANGGHNSQDGDIDIFDTTTANLGAGERATLTLDAQGDIFFHSGAQILSGLGALSLNLNAGTKADGSRAGTNDSQIIMDRTSEIHTGGGDLLAVARGQVTLGQVDTGTGRLTISSHGGDVGQSAAWDVGGITLVWLGGPNQDIVLRSDNHLKGPFVVRAEPNKGATLGTLALRNLQADIAFPTLPSPSFGSLDLQYPAAPIHLPNGLRLTGNLNLLAGGLIDQAGAIGVTGTSTLTAPTITLANADNRFTGQVTLGGGDAQLVDSVALNAVLQNAGEVSLTSKGNVSAVSARGGGADSLLIDSDANARSNVFVTGALTIHADGDVNLANAVGSLDVTAGGAVSQDAGTRLTVGDTTRIDAGGAITLANAGNDFGGDVSIVNGAGISLVDANDLHVVELHNVTDTAVSLVAAGALTLNPAIQRIDTGKANLTLSSGSAMSIGIGLVGQDVSLTGRGGLILNRGVNAHHNLSLSTTNADIVAKAAVGVVGTTTLVAGTGDINVSAGNDFVGTVTVRGDAVTLSDKNAVSIAGTATTLSASALGGNLDSQVATVGNSTLQASGHASNAGHVGGSLEARGGSVSNSGEVNHNATLIASAGGAANSGDVGGELVASGASASNSGDVGLNTTLTGNNGSAANSGAVGGNLVATGTTASNSGDVAFDATLDGKAGNVTNSGDVGGTLHTTGAQTVISGTLGGLEVDASGQVLQQAGSTLVVRGNTSITSDGQSVILANEGNDFVGLVTLVGHKTDDPVDAILRLHDVNDLSVGTISLGRNESLELSAAKGLKLAAQDLDAGTGSITLASGAAFATSGALRAADIRLDSQGGLTIAHDLTAQETLALEAAGADIRQTAGSIRVGGATSVQAGTGHITLADAGNDFGGTVTLAGGSATLVDADDLTLSARVGGALIVRAGATNVSGDVGSLELTAAGDVRQPAGLVVHQGTHIDARGHDVALGNTGNDFQGAVVVNADDLTLADRNALNLGATTLAGALTATTGGAVTQSGALVVAGASTFDAGASAVSLTNDGNELAGIVSSLGSGAIDLHNDRATVLGVVGSNGAQAAGLEVHSNGDVSQAGAAHVSGDVTIHATDGHGHLYAIDMSNADNELATSEGVHGADPVGGAAVATFIGSGLTYNDNAGLGNVSRVDVDGIAGDASITTTGSRIGLFGESFNGRTLALSAANTGGSILEKETSGQYRLGKNVRSVTTSPTSQNLRLFFHADSGSTELNQVQVTALEQMGGIALGSTVSTVIDEERRERERAAGYGRVRQGMRLNSISFDEMIAPLQYKQLEVSHAPCAREQSEGLDDLSCLPAVQKQE